MLLKYYHNNLNAFSVSCTGKSINHLCRIYRELCKHYEVHHGKTFMVRYMKNLNSIAERYSMYQPIDPIKFRKSDRDGFPNEIKAFKPWLRSENHDDIKIALSIFRSVEALRLPPDHDISTVIQQPVYELDTIKDIVDYVPKFVSKFRNKLRYRDLYYHFTVKNGPNGPALMTSDTDYAAVLQDPMIYQSIKIVSEELNDTKLPDSEFKPEKEGIHSKLTQFSEKAGKTRTIAVVDYYSQRALHPLHSALMDLLASMESDGTYNQNNVGNYVQSKTLEKSFVETGDMTAFTDLFPAVIQQKLLYCLVENRTLAKAWWTLLKKRTFRVSWSGDDVKYGTGQPMGAYASWALCTLAHHLIIHYSAEKTKQSKVNSHYRIIGDDNVITNKVISEYYKEVLTKIGCKLNPYKGTCSVAGVKYSSAEVAKRLYLNGINISPLTPGIIKNLTNPKMLNQGLADLLTIYDNPALPVQIIENVVRKQDRDYAWMLCTNPFNGVIKPGIPGYENYDTIWTKEMMNNKDAYFKEVMTRFRIQSLMNKATDITDERIGPYGSWARLTVKSALKQSGQSGNDTAPQFAQLEARRHLNGVLWKAIDELDQSFYENSEFDLNEIEYMPDPRNPFKDRKDLRNIHASLLVEKVYTFLKAGKEAVEIQW